MYDYVFFFFFQAEDGIRDVAVTGVQTCALPICRRESCGSRSASAQSLEHSPRGARVNGGGGAGDALEGILGCAVQLERERGTEQQAVAVRTAPLPGQHRLEPAGVVSGTAAREIRGAAAPKFVPR